MMGINLFPLFSSFVKIWLKDNQKIQIDKIHSSVDIIKFLPFMISTRLEVSKPSILPLSIAIIIDDGLLAFPSSVHNYIFNRERSSLHIAYAITPKSCKLFMRDVLRKKLDTPGHVIIMFMPSLLRRSRCQRPKQILL